MFKVADSKEYEIAQTLVNFNQTRKNSTDAIIDKNIYLFSEFQKYTRPSSSSFSPPDCLIQLAPIRDPVVQEVVKEEDSLDDDDDDEEEVYPRLKKRRSNEKPRWSNPMRHALLMAIIEQKELSEMASFNWASIGKQVGRSGKACKDQWRRAILPKLQHMYEEDFENTLEE
jgi:hypothetical protein